MNDVFDAIERLSAELSTRIGRLAERRGWGHKPYSWMVANGDKPILLVNTTVTLPGGFYASFTPRIEPSGSTWPIDVRRTDGVTRPAWSSGLSVQKTDRGFAIVDGGGPLDDERLAVLLDAIAEP